MLVLEPERWQTPAMTYVVVALAVLIVGLVIENARRGPLRATRTGSQADGGADGGDGGG